MSVARGTHYQIVPAGAADVAAIAAQLRGPDRAELYASTGMIDAAAAIAQSVALSAGSNPGPRVGQANGVSVCIFGVAPANLVAGTGCPWMVGTDLLEPHARHFLRACGGVVMEMRADYRILRNWVDARNELAIKWLQWLGFTLQPAQPHGPFGLDFHAFEMAGRGRVG